MKVLILIICLITSLAAENQIEFLNNKVFKKLSLSKQKTIAKYYFDVKLADVDFFNLSKKEQKRIYNNFYNKVINLETTNEWSMLYSNSGLGSCQVSSKYIEGAKLTNTYFIIDSKDIKYSVDDKIPKYQLFYGQTIEFKPNIIKHDKCTLLINEEEKEFSGNWNNEGIFQCFQITEQLQKGRDVTLKLMKTNGDRIEIPFKSSNSFLDKTQKCETVVKDQINILNKRVLNKKVVASNTKWVKIPLNKKEARLINGSWVEIPSGAKYVNSLFLWSENSNKLTLKKMVDRIGYDYQGMKNEGYSNEEILKEIKTKIFVKKLDFNNNVKRK